MENMLFNDFRKELVLRCAAVYANNPDIEISAREVNKLTESYEALAVESEKMKAALCMHIEDLYEEYRENGSWEAVVNHVQSVVKDKLYSEEMRFSTDDVFDYEKVKDRLFVRVTNLYENKEFLSAVPHKDYGEFAVTAHVKVMDQADGLCSTPVTAEILAKYGISEEELFETAMRSSQKLFPAEMIAASVGMDLVMYTLTNSIRTNGAVCLFYPGMIERLTEIAGDDVYVIPSSIHEMMIFPASIVRSGPEGLREILHEANRTLVEKGGILSENVYWISKDEKKLVLPHAYAGIVN